MLPFHRSIIDAIGKVGNIEEARLIAGLIKETTIPADHAEIRKAWQEMKEELEIEDLNFGVATHLKAEQARVEAEKALKEKAVEVVVPVASQTEEAVVVLAPGGDPVIATTQIVEEMVQAIDDGGSREEAGLARGLDGENTPPVSETEAPPEETGVVESNGCA